jgi:hypothetical protein
MAAPAARLLPDGIFIGFDQTGHLKNIMRQQVFVCLTADFAQKCRQDYPLNEANEGYSPVTSAVAVSRQSLKFRKSLEWVRVAPSRSGAFGQNP